MSEKYGEDYYIYGRIKGLSNYTNYRWMPERTVPACKKVMQYLGARPGESIVDIGAALGFYVRAFRELGLRAFGVDISEWALTNSDPLIREFMSRKLPKRAFDWAHLKDLAEHLPVGQLVRLVETLDQRISKGMLFIVPLAVKNGGSYVREEDEWDSTHIIRWTLHEWLCFMEDHAPGFNVNASYDIHGIKPASSLVKRSCGFLTLTRP